MKYIKKFINNIISINIHKRYYIMLFMIIIIALTTFIILKFLLKTDLYNSIDFKNKIIFFGQTVDLNVNNIGIDYSNGFKLAFQSYNRNGGINGYKLNIILYNDNYDNDIALNNAKLLIDYYNVLCLLGSFGTGPTVSILDKCIKTRNIPLIGPYTATETWRKKFYYNVILMNGTFYNEFKLIVKHLLKNKISKISIIYQNDISGKDYYDSFINYLILNNLPINVISSGNFEKNTNDLENCYKSLLNIKNVFNYNEYTKSDLLNEIQAVFVICSSEQISSILGYLKKIKPSLFIYYNYFSGISKSNYKNLEKYNKNNIYQTLLTYNIKQKFPIIYNKLEKETFFYNKKNDIKIIDDNNIALYRGFITGLMICEILKEFKDMSKLNRDNFLNMFYSKKYIKIDNLDIGPFINGISNQGINYASLNQYINNDLEVIDEIYD